MYVPEHFLYLWVDLGCILIPFVFSFHPKVQFYKQWKFYFLPNLLTTIFFIFWDSLFTSLDVWHFNPEYITGYTFFSLPIEEIAFFICIPYACTFTFYLCKIFIKKQFNSTIYNRYALIGSILMLLISIAFPHRLYTCVTFLLLAILFLWLSYRKVNYLPIFFIAYLCILLPFFLANGLLTGGFTKQAVVIYNNAENLNIRIWTIPIEDFFYGMLLLLMNISGYMYFAQRTEKTKYVMVD